MRRKTTEEFIADAVAVHGNTYDYSKVVYTTAKKKVTIICKIHGDFEQIPDNHLLGKGCSVCKGGVVKTTEDFIYKATLVHGNRYVYHRSKYENNSTKISIECREHGEFLQIPSNHLKGKGCSICGGSNRLTVEEFIKDARYAHGDKYDYSLVNYKNNRTKVSIKCKEHGEFLQVPANHLNGNGCPECVIRKTTDEFIAGVIAVHGNKYDYSKVVYTTCKDKVVIICKIHGEFLQTPNGHLSGQGCPNCSKNGFDRRKHSVVYVYTFGEYVGFGITGNFKVRDRSHRRNFRRANIEATLIATYDMSGEEALKLETNLKRILPITDSSIYGFKTEATNIENLNIILDEVNLTMNKAGV